MVAMNIASSWLALLFISIKSDFEMCIRDSNYIRVHVNKSDVKPNEIKAVQLKEFDRKGDIRGWIYETNS